MKCSTLLLGPILTTLGTVASSVARRFLPSGKYKRPYCRKGWNDSTVLGPSNIGETGNGSSRYSTPAASRPWLPWPVNSYRYPATASELSTGQPLTEDRATGTAYPSLTARSNCRYAPWSPTGNTAPGDEQDAPPSSSWYGSTPNAGSRRPQTSEVFNSNASHVSDDEIAEANPFRNLGSTTTPAKPTISQPNFLRYARSKPKTWFPSNLDRVTGTDDSGAGSKKKSVRFGEKMLKTYFFKSAPPTDVTDNVRKNGLILDLHPPSGNNNSRTRVSKKKKKKRRRRKDFGRLDNW